MSYNAINGSVNGFALAIVGSFNNKNGMGRPPLGMKPTTVRLSVDTVTRIEALVGKRRVALFIREAAEKELKQRETTLPAQD